MPTVTLPAGTLHYRVAGPADCAPPPVVFVHGLLVNAGCGTASPTRWPPRASAPTSRLAARARTPMPLDPTPTSSPAASPR